MKFLTLIIFLSFIFNYSCKDQCQILEDNIVSCKKEMNCTDSNTSYSCDEIESAESLIKSLNSKITETSSEKINMEATCLHK